MGQVKVGGGGGVGGGGEGASELGSYLGPFLEN